MYYKTSRSWNKSKRETQKYLYWGVPVMAQWLTNQTSIHEEVGLIPGLAQWVKDSALPWAVVLASSHSSDWIPSLGTSICHRCSPKRSKKKKKKRRSYEEKYLYWLLFHFNLLKSSVWFSVVCQKEKQVIMLHTEGRTNAIQDQMI